MSSRHVVLWLVKPILTFLLLKLKNLASRGLKTLIEAAHREGLVAVMVMMHMFAHGFTMVKPLCKLRHTQLLNLLLQFMILNLGGLTLDRLFDLRHANVAISAYVSKFLTVCLKIDQVNTSLKHKWQFIIVFVLFYFGNLAN